MIAGSMACECSAEGFGDMVGQGGAGARINQQGLGGDAFSEDNLMVLKEDLKVVDKPAFLNKNALAVDEVARLKQHFCTACSELVFALVDKEAVVWGDEKIVLVVKRALCDHHRGEITYRADGVMTDPADFLWAIVPCEEFVSDFEGFDGALFACGKAQACAACERDTGYLSKAQRFSASIPTRR